ncbi:MAG: hypothetical protein U1F98_06815 [Verrucomicrobiota bacterium]
MIDDFTILDQGRVLLKMDADGARDRFKRIRARFAEAIPQLGLSGALEVKRNGREIEILSNGNSDALVAELKSKQPEALECESLSLEEIFVASRTLGHAGV